MSLKSIVTLSNSDIRARAMLDIRSTEFQERLVESERRTTTCLNGQEYALAGIQTMLQDSRELIIAGNKVGEDAARTLSWIRKLGLELKRFLCMIAFGNMAIYREVVALRSALATQIPRSLSEEPFILEDALGRVSPVHLGFITSWEAFDAVLMVRFKDQYGFSKICRKEYMLHEDAAGTEINRVKDFQRAILPGQRLVMSIIFNEGAKENCYVKYIRCPRCRTVHSQDRDPAVVRW